MRPSGSNRAWFRATRLIRRAVGRHRRVQELDPGFRDAYLVPGTCVYSIARLPRPLRMVAFHDVLSDWATVLRQAPWPEAAPV